MSVLRLNIFAFLTICSLMASNVSAITATAAEFRMRDAATTAIRSSLKMDGELHWKPDTTPDQPAAAGTIQNLSFSDPATGVQVQTTTTVFRDFPVVEWITHIRNTGTTDTPVLRDIRAIHSIFPVPTTGSIQLHWSKGGVASFDDFAPQSAELKRGAPLTFNPVDGRSSSEILPFFNVQGSGGGIIVAIGWSGRWAAEFERVRESEIRMAAGMAETHLKLHPGEEIRTPRMIALFYEGNRDRGQNLLRRFILAHHRPKKNGAPLVAPITNGNWGATRAEVHMSNIRGLIRERLPIEYYWIDAGWYGDPSTTEVSSWATNVGNWEVRRNLYPKGFKPLSRELKAAGRELMLWFEPERVYTGTPWHREHADWLLSDGGSQFLMNLGNLEAREFVTEFISGKIDEFGLGCYRQDFNMDPAPNWKKADAPDRVGISEIRHIDGLYAFWDGLLARHPNLIIDNCASGGRRIDLETIGRSTPFWRTDGPRDPIAHQCHTYGLLSWVPLSSTSQDIAGDDYEFRSSMCSALCINWEHSGDGPQSPIREDFPYDWARRTLAQYLSIRDYYYGDYYPLTPYSKATDAWMAYQLDRQESGDGTVVALRRPESAEAGKKLVLRGLDAAEKYEVTNLDTREVTQASGADLMSSGLPVTILTKPGSALLTYRRR